MAVRHLLAAATVGKLHSENRRSIFFNVHKDIRCEYLSGSGAFAVLQPNPLFSQKLGCHVLSDGLFDFPKVRTVLPKNKPAFPIPAGPANISGNDFASAVGASSNYIAAFHKCICSFYNFIVIG